MTVTPLFSWIKNHKIMTLGAIALLGALSAAIIYTATQKSVLLDIEGQQTQVHTHANTVSEVLEDAGYVVTDRDLVTPGLDVELSDGTTVAVKYSRPIQISVDGATQTIWTTEQSVSDALAAVAPRLGSVELVSSRSYERLLLPLSTDLIRLVVDGESTEISSDATTLTTFLREAGVELGANDRYTSSAVVPSEAGVGFEVVVERVVIETQTDVSEVPFETVEQKDANSYTGTRTVVTAGAAGELTTTYRVTLVDGVEESRDLVSEEVTVEPVTEVVSVGTKVRPVKVDTTPRGGRTWEQAEEQNWAGLAKCESGGSATIVSASGKYHGLYQFSVATWKSVGGTGLPSEASADEQTRLAKALWVRSGPGQWPHCQRYL